MTTHFLRYKHGVDECAHSNKQAFKCPRKNAVRKGTSHEVSCVLHTLVNKSCFVLLAVSRFDPAIITHFITGKAMAESFHFYFLHFSSSSKH